MAPTDSLNVVIVRHAERLTGTTDPALSAAGRARAALLARMLTDAPLAEVYVTATRRSRQTGERAALPAGAPVTEYDSLDAAALATSIMDSHPSGTVLVIAHSNTVDDVAAALGASGVGQLTDTQFDRMFVVTINAGAVGLLRLCYGRSTP